MADLGPISSRRALLGAFTTAPLAALSLEKLAAPWSAALADLHEQYDDNAAVLQRSPEGRRLSRVRYHRAESFFESIERGFLEHRGDLLYQAGIVAQLGLSAHLLDIGFDNRWCARNIGLRVANSLAYANATGLGLDDPEIQRLSLVLTPYNQWNQPRLWDEPELDDGGFTRNETRLLLRRLLDHIHRVTGHKRPDGWRRRAREAEA